MMDEFLIMNAEDYKDICDAFRYVTNSSDTLTIGEILALADGLTSSELEDAMITRTLTSFSDEQLTSFRKYAFAYQKNLTDIDLPNLTTISEYAFYGCTGLESVRFPSLTKSSGRSNFQGCTKLKSADFPVLGNLINNFFYGCSSLESVNIPSATSIAVYAFYGCKKLVSIDLPSVTTIGDTGFRLCSALESLIAPKLKTVGNSTFRQCTALALVDLAVATKVSNYGFGSCSALTALILRNTTLCTLASTTGLEGTKIASGTGYIYVPAALVDSYKAATNWSTYADQFRALEDYTVDGTITGELDETKIAA